MIKRNFPLLLLILVFAALFTVPFMDYKEHTLSASIEPEPEEVKSFTGRMIMPSLDDLYVLDNSAGRDLLQFEKFLQGRAAGLHWLAVEHFKKERAELKQQRKKGAPLKDIYIGLKLTLDSLGYFAEPEILFSNSDDQDFVSLVQNHIKAYWRYPRSTQGKLEVWVPVIWRGDWKK